MTITLDAGEAELNLWNWLFFEAALALRSSQQQVHHAAG
jgi:hypothetical protein